MVLRGQFLERSTLIPLGGEVLEGLSHRGERSPALLIVPPPPDQGGSMDHVVAAEIAWAAAMAGHPTLRFNFRGVGASQGQRARGPELLPDVHAALELLEKNVSGAAGGEVFAKVAIVALGGSSELALALAGDARVQGLCLVAPPVADSKLPPGVPLRVILAGEFDQDLPMVGKAVVRWLESLPQEAESL